jgi:ATP-dependent RNA helicase SUPV3L1/SUV3
MEEALDAARAVDLAKLPIREAFAFAVAPIDRRDALSKAMLDRWAQAHAAGAVVPALRARFDGELDDLERMVKLTAAYLWLGRRFPQTFDETEATKALRGRANAAIEAHLRETATRTVGAGHYRTGNE